MDLFQVIDGLYDSEINCGLQTFWDGGITAWLGDEMNGRQSEQTFCRENMADAAAWLHLEALRLYPGSDYAMSPPAAGSADV